jgi:hypothetical protein
VLFAASDVEDEADIADAFHSSLKEDEGMKVLGGGRIEIDFEGERITVNTTVSTLGPSDPTLVEKTLRSSYEDYQLHVNQI